jgi:hypothetical protein
MISCKGEGWTGKKYAKLAYFPAISGNSGVQKGQALLDSTSDYSKCDILFLLCLNLSQCENSYPTIPYHYRHRNSTILGENTLIKH